MQYRKSVFRSLAMVTQLGLCLLTPIFICVFIGYQIDGRFGTKIMIPMLILGVLGGARNAWRLIQSILDKERQEDEAIRQARMSQSTRTGISKPKQPSRIIRMDEQADGERKED